MTYFNLNYITDPPDDELVNPQTQLNANFTEFDNKLQPFRKSPADFKNYTIPKGTEAFDPDPTHNDPTRIAAFTGTTWARSLNHIGPWTGWQLIDIRPPLLPRPGFPVQARVNSLTRQVELQGGVILNSTSDAFSRSTTYEITTDTTINDLTFAPVGGYYMEMASSSAITTAGGYAGAVAIVETKTNPSRVAISVRYQGDAGGGNFIMLDNVGWWF